LGSVKIPPILYASVATFGVTLALLLRPHNGAGETDGAPALKATEIAPAERIQQRAELVSPTSPPPTISSSPSVQRLVAGGAGPAEEEQAPQDESGKELPVRVIFHQAGESRAEAIVVSDAEETLDVLLTVKNADGKFAQVPFSVEPGAFKKFGAQGDLPIESGDRVILQSRSFQDLSEIAP